MERKPRRKFSADFKAKVVIEALKERSTMEELARKYELHPNQITIWKKEFLTNAAAVFSIKADLSDDKIQQEADAEKLFAQIGRLKMENEWLKKKLQ
jgi:transposase-like protein